MSQQVPCRAGFPVSKATTAKPSQTKIRWRKQRRAVLLGGIFSEDCKAALDWLEKEGAALGADLPIASDSHSAQGFASC